MLQLRPRRASRTSAWRYRGADAVYVERVSATEFPANREINRENRKNGPWVMTRSSFNAAPMPVFIDIPYEN
jgi:hypothetical protein